MLTLSGCAMTFDATELGVPTAMAESAQSPLPADAKTFRVTKHPVFLLWGLVGVARPNIEDVLAGQVGAGSRITNLRIRVRSRLMDLFVTALTLGTITPRSVTFEGAVLPATTSSQVGP